MDPGLTSPDAAPVVLPLVPPPDPVALLAACRDLPRPLLLDGADPLHPLGRRSYLMADPVAIAEGDAADWPTLADRLRATLTGDTRPDPALPPFQGGWAGWFGYELGAAFDRMPRVAHPSVPLPDCSLALYDVVIAWDHATGDAWLISTGVDATGRRSRERAVTRAAAWAPRLRAATEALPPAPPPAAAAPATADFTPAAYRTAVAQVVDAILAGDLFQANLTQRFTVPVAEDPVTLYRRLRARTPAPMGAFLAHPRAAILSASPERFLRYDAATRAIETRPIKGTRRRVDDAGEDAAQVAALLASAKDRAENVMIVDLLRNDLSRVAEAGSVAVPALCRHEAHPTVHHLVSIVTATLREGLDALDLLAATFPGGSITGAPKLRAMALLADLERVTRGVYCGAIGWLGLDGAMDTAIAIRTMTVADGVAAVHAGGGVTARSTPEEEYQESLDKARALLGALGAAP